MTKLSDPGIVIIGAGNVASYMAVSLHRAGHCIDMIYSRTLSNARRLAEKVSARWTSDFDKIDQDADVMIFALTDQAIIERVENMNFSKSLLVHTAGSLPMSIFSGHSEQYGVLYPLQTISKHRLAVLSDIPFCIEANHESALATLRSLARSIGYDVYNVSSEKRVYLHLAAVFACNFSNHMYTLAERVAETAGLPFELFKPLIRETAEKAIDTGPLNSQTGPAVRNDMVVINKHLELLSFSPELRSIYHHLTSSIRMPGGHNKANKAEIMKLFKEELHKVKAFVFDVDGVFSDESLLLDPNGDLIRSMNIKDGYALQLAVRKGYPVAIITGGNSEAVRKRFNMLGVHDLYLKSSKKLDDFTDFCNKYKLEPENILYMGDDLPDYPVMKQAGFPTCPLDADPEIKNISVYVSDRKGGEGCVRDVIEQVLRAHGIWMDADAFIL